MAWVCGNVFRSGVGAPAYGGSSLAESLSCDAVTAMRSATHGTRSSKTFHSRPSTPSGRNTRPASERPAA